MMKRTRISVIVPVYNGENYLRDCVDSILAQTYCDLEIILVNDGSVDTSSAICDEYTSKYSNVHVIHQSNGVVTKARWNGVVKSTGEWITFVDADDTLPSDAMESLFNVTSEETDIVIGGVSETAVKAVTTLEHCQHCIVKGNCFSPSIWGKLIRKQLLTKYVMDFPRDITKGEDQLMNIRLLFATKKMPVFVTKNIYNYRRNIMSVSHRFHTTVAYEAKYDQYRIQSIPPSFKDEFMSEIMHIRLSGLTGCAMSDAQTLCDKKNPYLKLLREDIDKSQYNVNFQEWLLLNIRWPWLYKAVAFIIMVKNYTFYHLGLNG